MTIVRFPFPAALAAHDAEFDEPLVDRNAVVTAFVNSDATHLMFIDASPLAALDRLAVYVEPEIALARAPFGVARGIAGWIGVIATACGFGALAYGVFG